MSLFWLAEYLNVTYSSFSSLFSRSLGGKLGASVIEVLGIEYMGDLTQFTESQLQSHFGEKNG
jgi:nucleotidyltransferase/DNA polymerase involved in DNA repair